MTKLVSSRAQSRSNQNLLVKRSLALLLSGVAVVGLSSGAALAQTTQALGNYAPDHYNAGGSGQYLPGVISKNPTAVPPVYGQNDNQAGQWEVNDSTVGNVLNGSYATFAPGRGNTAWMTLRQIADLQDADLDNDTMDPAGFGGSRIDPTAIENGTGTRIVLGSRTKEVKYIDPINGEEVTVNVFNDSNLSVQNVQDQYLIWHETQDQEAYLDPRIATVSAGSGLEVTVGNATGATTDAANMLHFHAKASPETGADDIISAYKVEGNGSTLEYATNTRVDFGEFPTPGAANGNGEVVQQATITNVLFDRGVEIAEDVTWTDPVTGDPVTILAGPIDSAARLEEYNHYLIHLIETNEFREKFGLLPTDDIGARYQTLIQATYRNSDPVTVDYIAAYKPKPIQDMGNRERTMFHGVGDTTVTINAGQTIEDVTAGAQHSIAYLENDAKLENHGTLASSYTEHGIYAKDDAIVTNHSDGVISNYVDGITPTHYSRAVEMTGDSTLNNAGTINVAASNHLPSWLTPPVALTGSSQRQDDSTGAWNYGVGLFDRAEATNTGTINVGVNSTAPTQVSLVDGVYVEGDGVFTNTGDINIGKNDAGADTNNNNAILTGVRVLGDGKASNNGTITIGGNTGNAAAMYAGQGRVGSGTIGTGQLELINNGDIIVNGNRGGSPNLNYGMYAENVDGTIEHNGKIELNGVSARGIQVLGTTTATHVSTSATSTIDVKGGVSPTANTRNYGVWVEGGQATADLAGKVNLEGNFGIGVHARTGGDIDLAPTASVNFIAGGENQIGYFIHGAGSTINNVSSTMDVSNKNSTLFRIEDGASFADLVGATGGQLTASGEGATILHVTGAGATANMGAGTYTAEGTGSIAVKVDGGATAVIQDSTTIELTGDNSIGGIVDGYKNNINGSTGSTVVAGTTLTNNAEVESDADGVTGFIAGNGGTLNNNETITFTGQNTKGIVANNAGVVNNIADISIEHGQGLVSNNGGIIHNTGEVTVSVGRGQGMVANGGYAENNADLEVGDGIGVWALNGGTAVNSGDVTVTSGTGLLSEDEDSTITNTGDLIDVENGNGIEASTGGEVDNSANIEVENGNGIVALDGGTVTNTGDTIEVADGLGIYAEDTGNVENSADIDVTLGDGIHAVDGGTVVNTGSQITVTGTAALGANGIVSDGGNVTNGADIDVDFGNGIVAHNNGVVTTTGGTITVGDGNGILSYGEVDTVNGGYTGGGVVTSASNIDVVNGVGIRAHSGGQVTNNGATIDVVTGKGIQVSHTSEIENAAAITVTTGEGIHAHDNGIANNTGTIDVTTGTGIVADNSEVENSGDITVATGRGIYALNDGRVENSGTIDITTQGIGIEADDAYVQNSGDITVQAQTGIYAHDDAIVENSANIIVTTWGTGIAAEAGANVTNTGGLISVAGDSSDLFIGTGIFADDAEVTNSADIEVDYGRGIVATNDANVENSGDITIINGAGIVAFNSGTVTNTGSQITVEEGTGIVSTSGSTVINDADISVTTGDGILADNGIVENIGDIEIIDGRGIVAANGADVTNTGDITVDDGLGIIAADNAAVNNTGNIDVTTGEGIVVLKDGEVVNSGTVDVADGIGALVQDGGRFQNAPSGTITVQDGTGLLVENTGGATTPANISNAADIIVNDGVAGIHVRNGASLDASAFSGTVTVDGSAHGVLVGQDATGLILGQIGIVTNGDGNGLENARELTGIQLRDTHITVNGPASGVRTGVSLATGSSAVIDVNGAGSTGFRFELADGSSTNQTLVMGDEIEINLTPLSSNAFGIVANTTGDADIATTLNDEGTDNIAVLIERANNVHISSNIDVNTSIGSGGTGIYLTDVAQAIISGDVNVGANGGSALVVENAASFVVNTGNLISQSVAPVVDLSPSNGTDFLNFGTIAASDYQSLAILGSAGDDFIRLGRDLTSGAESAVTGVVATGGGADEVLWDAGTLIGSIEMGDGDNDTLTVVGRDLSTVYHLDGGAGAGDTLNLASIVYHGGTFANDDAFGVRTQGVNLGQDWENINLTNNSRFTLTGNLLFGDEMFVDSSSVLFAGNNVNPLVGKPGGNLRNHGILDLTNGVYSLTDTATVGGDYIGGPASAPSQLILNTYLGTDTSPTDKLFVSGGTSGQTAIRILRDPSSPGELTTGDGILLVRVDQDSNSNAVFTAPSMIEGAYEYNLHKGGIVNPLDGDWYLRSHMTTSAQTTLAYGSSLLGFAKNIGSLQQRTGGRVWSNPEPQRPAETVWCKDASQNFSCTLTPEQSAVYADNAGSTTLYGGGLWARIGGDIGRENPRQGAGYDTKSWYMQAGAEGVVNERESGLWTAGIFGTYGKQSVDVAITSAPNVPDPSRFGSISTDAYGVAGNLTWLGNDGLYFDAVAQYMWYRSNLSSSGFGGFARDNNATGYTFSAEVGKSYNINESWSFVPQAQLVYTNISHADFVIANPDPLANVASIAVSGGKGSSLVGRLGVRLDHKSRNEHDGKVDRVQAYGIANLYYDFLDGSQVNIGGSTLKQKNARLWGEVGVGGTFAFNDKVSLYGEARYATSLENFGKSHNIGGNIGLRYNW